MVPLARILSRAPSSAASGILLVPLWVRRRCYPLHGRSGNVPRTSECVRLRPVIEEMFLGFLHLAQRKYRPPERLEIQVELKQQEQ